MEEFEIRDGVLTAYNGKDSIVMIPEGVTAIGDRAFRSNQTLEHLRCPESLIRIGEEAFAECYQLESVRHCENVREIGDRAFLYCSRLREVLTPTNVEKISSSAFGRCLALKRIELPAEVQIGPGAFRFCESLTDRQGLVIVGLSVQDYLGKYASVTVPEGIREIGCGAFADHESLRYIHLPDSVRRIRTRAFTGCRNLHLAKIPKNAELEENAFRGCKALVDRSGYAIINGVLIYAANQEAERYVPAGVVRIEPEAFCDAYGLQSVRLPEGLRSIGAEAFSLCSSLQSIRLPDSVTGIGPGAFRSCRNLADAEGFVIVGGILFDYFGKQAEVRIPESVTRIEKGIFEGMKGSRSIVLPDSLTDIDADAFRGLDVILEAPQIPFGEKLDTKLKRSLLRGFAAGTEKGRAYTGEQRKAYLRYLRSQRRKLYPYAVGEVPLLRLMLKERILTEADFDDVLKAASETGNAEAVTLLLEYRDRVLPPDREERAMEREMDFAMTGKMTLTEARKYWYFKELPDGTLSITGCRWKERNAVVPAMIGKKAVTRIDSDFSHRTGWDADRLRKYRAGEPLESVVIPEGVTVIEIHAFRDLPELREVSLPESLQEIGDCAFMECPALREIRIPGGVTEIGGRAFDEEVTLRTPAGSAAEAYAKKYGNPRITE